MIARHVLLPVASGLLLAASAPPTVTPVLPFVALVPLAVFLTDLPGGVAGERAAALGGAFAGALQHAWGLRWMAATLGAIAGEWVGRAVFIAVVAALAALTGAAAWALHRAAARGRPIPFAAALPVAWTALEWGLAHLPFGLGFPWAPLGLGLARWPRSIGIAELAGVGGVTFWLGGVNGLIADGIVAARTRRGRTRAGALLATAALLAAVPIAWGHLRAAALELREVGAVAALSAPRAVGASDPERAAAGVGAADLALAAVPRDAAELVVLPEMLVPLDPGSAAAAAPFARLRARADALGAPILVGALGVDGAGEHNSALLVRGVAEGETGPPFRADKRHLVPGVERATLGSGSWLTRGAAGFAPGVGVPVAALERVRVGVLVCYDVAFASAARAAVSAGARAIAVLTSDAWFGEGGGREAGVAQQLAHLTYRAVETRTGAARASAGGPAVLVDPTGRIVARAEAAGAPSAPAVALGVLRAANRPTLYVRTGDRVGPAAVVALAVLLIL